MDMSTEERCVRITREPVELYKILKFEGLVGSGGEAKVVIDAGDVVVNGLTETRRRRKIVANDVIVFGLVTLHVERDA